MIKILKCISDKVCEILTQLQTPPATKTAVVPQCGGSTTTETVDEINAVYLLNEQHYSVQKVFDVVSATITGNITSSIVGSVVTINPSTLSTTNDTNLGYLIDWGNGFTDIITPTATSIYDFINQPTALANSKYEVKIYEILQSGNIVLLTGIEYNFNGTAVTQITANPISINRNFPVKRNEVLQRYCDNTLLGAPFNANGSAYTPVGTIQFLEPVVRDERFSNADVTLAGSTTTPVVTPLENASNNRVTGAQAVGATTVTSPAFTGARDVTVYNSYNATIAFEYTTTVNGIFHRILVPRGATWSNTLKKDAYADEGTYTAGRVIFPFIAGVAGAAATPNEVIIDWST